MSWNATSLEKVDAQSLLFTLVFKSQRDGQLSESLSLYNNSLTNEAYVGSDLSISDVDLNFTQDSGIDFQLNQNNPNPFSDRTEINFFLPEEGNAMLTITDLSGKVIMRSIRPFNKGLNTVKLTDAQLNGHTGVLLFNLTSGDHHDVIKMIKL